MDKTTLYNSDFEKPQSLISRRDFVKNAGLVGGAVAGTLLLAGSCKKSITVATIIANTTTDSSAPPTAVRLPPINGLEYLVNENPADVDNSRLPVTPPELLHILNPSPHVDIAGYRLNIHGLTENPLNLAYSDLMQFSMKEQTSLLICPTVFADNETLRGFTLASLMLAAGVKTEAIQIVFRCLDNVQQMLSISDALAEDALLALEVDGQTLSSGHGYPLRLIRPGQIGVFWLKCVNDIEFV